MDEWERRLIKCQAQKHQVTKDEYNYIQYVKHCPKCIRLPICKIDPEDGCHYYTDLNGCCHNCQVDHCNRCLKECGLCAGTFCWDCAMEIVTDSGHRDHLCFKCFTK